MYTEARYPDHSSDRSADFSANTTVDSDLRSTLTVRPATFELSALSFGAAADYARCGGQPVIADDAPIGATPASHDLTRGGLCVPRDLIEGRRALGAFVVGAQSIHVRAELATDVDGRVRAFVRAFAGGQERVGEYAVTFDNGLASIDLPVTGISAAMVGTLDESWRWECRLEGGDFVPIGYPFGEDTIDEFPVRLYFTAGRTISACPRESFYQVACAVPGARDQQQVERDIWRHFTAFHRGRFVCNANGRRLGFWRESKPGMDNAAFIARDARDLVMHADSSCRGWAELFREALAAHGIASTVRAVRPKLSAVHPRLGLPSFLAPDGRGGNMVLRTIGILVKPFKWTPQNQLAPFPFTREQAEFNVARFQWKIENPADPAAFDWPQADVQDMMRPGHTSTDERDTVGGMFGNHAVVLVKHADGSEAWYDPSFGFGPHASLLSYENEMLGRGEVNHGGLFAIVGWKRERRLNPATGQVEDVNAGLLLGAAPPPPGPVLEAVDPD